MIVSPLRRAAPQFDQDHTCARHSFQDTITTWPRKSPTVSYIRKSAVTETSAAAGPAREPVPPAWPRGGELVPVRGFPAPCASPSGGRVVQYCVHFFARRFDAPL